MPQREQQSPSLLSPGVTAAAGAGAVGRERGARASLPGAAPLLPPSLPPSDLLQLIKLFKGSLCYLCSLSVARQGDGALALPRVKRARAGAAGDGDEGHQHQPPAAEGSEL